MEIPKIIHYCWFGGNPIPEEYRKYIDSWKKYCPDYEIKEWNESNFDFNCCDYAKEAYEANKWAFVSDFARFKILYEYGGLYFDTDVEIIKSLDRIIEKGAFMGIEKYSINGSSEGKVGVNAGLGLGVAPGLGLYKEILDFYNQSHFLNYDGTYNTRTVVDYVTDILIKHGFKPVNKFQSIAGINIYPSDYFCPMDSTNGKVVVTNNTVSIHHYACSWESKHKKLTKKIQRILGPDITSIIMKIKHKIK